MNFVKNSRGSIGTRADINATATATVAQIDGGLIASTSAAPTTITTPTATQLAANNGADKGFSQKLLVDNSAGASIVTITPGAGITAASAVTGGTTMTVAAGAIGEFKITFVSKTAAIISRLH